MSTFKFTKTHEWIKTEGNEVVIGITEHAQQLLGDMVFVELPTIGDRVEAGAELGVVESVKAASDFYAPISGVVSAINDAVVQDPSLVNSAPYENGWLIKLKPQNMSEMDALLSEAEYQLEIAEEA